MLHNAYIYFSIVTPMRFCEEVMNILGIGKKYAFPQKTWKL